MVLSEGSNINYNAFPNTTLSVSFFCWRADAGLTLNSGISW